MSNKPSFTVTFEKEQFDAIQKRLDNDPKLDGKISRAVNEDVILANNYREILKKIESDNDSKVWTKDALRALLTHHYLEPVIKELTHYDICRIGAMMLNLAAENNLHLTKDSMINPCYNNGNDVKYESVFGHEYTINFQETMAREARGIIREEIEKNGSQNFDICMLSQKKNPIRNLNKIILNNNN